MYIAYSLADRTMEDRVLPLAQQRDLGIVLRSVLLRGALTDRYCYIRDDLAELRSVIEQLDELAGRDADSLPEMAYRFVLEHPAVSTALVGSAGPDGLEAALVFASRGPLSASLQARIRALAVHDRRQLNPAISFRTWSSTPAVTAHIGFARSN